MDRCAAMVKAGIPHHTAAMFALKISFQSWQRILRGFERRDGDQMKIEFFSKLARAEMAEVALAERPSWRLEFSSDGFVTHSTMAKRPGQEKSSDGDSKE